MLKPRLGLALVLLLSLSPLGAQTGSEAGSAPLIASGRWTGTLDFGEGAEELDLRILAQGGLLDLPGQRLFGYPLASLNREGGRLQFALFEGQGAGSAGQSGGSPLLFSGEALQDPEGQIHIAGKVSRDGQTGGSFDLKPAPAPAESGATAYVLDTGRGLLPGTLSLPDGAGPFPLVLLLAGAGTTDRDGNNYSVPGKNDALKLLAAALRERGVASLRYDKRGAGEAYGLVPSEESLSFDDYVKDAAAAIAALRGDRRFSRLVLAGHTEGALVATGALRLAAGQGVSGLALLCASGKSAVEVVEAAVAGAPPELQAEGAAIMEALKTGRVFPNPSGYFSDFFRPSFQPYLASWFRHDLTADLVALKLPLLLVQGNRDFQTSLAEFDLLLRARPDAQAFVLPGMNHALKEVGADLEENYQAFTDPGFPLAPQLAELLAAFAKGESLPEAGLRYGPSKP